MTPIRKDQSSLPVASRGGEGNVPDKDPWVGRALIDEWIETYGGGPNKPHAVSDTRFRFSQADNCTRQLAYYVSHAEPSDPPDASGRWRMDQGTAVHESLQSVLLKIWPEAELEVKVDGRPHVDGSGSVDLVIRTQRLEDGVMVGHKTVAVEIKTINGFGFKMAATSFKGAPEGPRYSHVVQGALGARGVDADELVILYVSMENVSPSLAKYSDDPIYGKFLAQWTYSKDEYLKLAESEDRRVGYVLDLLDGGQVPGDIPPLVRADDGQTARVFPAGTGGLVLESEGHELVPHGKTWRCDYCDYKAQCLLDG